ncbi:hypothetical protein C1H46_043716 [Malus baccata]|uniref:RNase H type-1 domain-containing protein n=1 Tax=Malus baccata TaxID=106549 RepID=A0A540K971_MALBA|nr:hypothetical protein C1H46_043716 [Malus baccata]
MCFRVECKQCGKTSWGGCGKHLKDLYAGIEQGKHCMCRSWPGVAVPNQHQGKTATQQQSLASASASNLGGVGAVFCDEANSYAGCFVCQISPALNPTMIELLAVRDGVCWAMQRNLPRIIVESDYLQVVQAIGSLKQGASHMPQARCVSHGLIGG